MGSFYPPTKPSKYQCDLDEYFTLISQKIFKFKSLNKNNKQQNKNINYNEIVNPIEEMNYKTSILSYFAVEYEKGNLWVAPLYRQINSQDFVPEAKWFNLLFWQEFELRNKPPCLNRKHTKRLFYPQSNYFTYELPNFSNKDILTFNYSNSQELVYTYVRIIKEHISNKDHPLHFIYKSFTKYFTNFLKERVEYLIDMKVHNNNNDFRIQCNKICTNIFNQLNDFICLLVQCLPLLYNKTFHFKIFTMEEDEFINLITSLIFEEENLSKYIIQLITLDEESQINEFNYLITPLSGISPYDAQIQDKFCLNESSLSFYETISKSKLKHNELSFIQQQPYEDTIELLQSITLYKTPFDKILLIYKLRKSIIDCITKFWYDIDKNMPMKDLGIEANDIINIFAYIIAKCQMSNLVAQVSFIKKFCPQKIMSSNVGLFFGYLETAMGYLNEIKDSSKNNETSLIK